MNLSAPTQAVFWISVILAVLALCGFFVAGIPIISAYPFWIAIIAYIVLAAGCMMAGT
jgi:hypothetical protein